MERYGAKHYWLGHINDFRGRYTGDGLWGCAFGLIGACIGIAAGKSSDYLSFRSLYMVQSIFVSVLFDC